MKNTFIPLKRSLNLLLISMLFSFAQCRRDKYDDELTIPLTNYTGNQLQLDGYYFHEGSNRNEIFFLYRNGVLLSGGLPLISEMEVQETEYANGSYYNYVKDDKTYWGRFVIDGNTIKYQGWNPSNGGPLHTITSSGTIENDTTYIIHSIGASSGDLNQVFHFKKFSPKPDSTNTFTD